MFSSRRSHRIPRKSHQIRLGIHLLLDWLIPSRPASLVMRSRHTSPLALPYYLCGIGQFGPFGLFQDPTIQPIVKQADSELPSRRQAALPAVPLLDIVKLIRVTTVMPREKMFLVGVRKFREGDEFPLEYQNKTLQIRVIDVTANKIRFRDMKTGEDAALETGILPPGMIIGGDREMRPPGMVSPTENTPLRLESGNLENR